MNVSTVTSMTGLLAEARIQREKQAQDRDEARLSAARTAVETLKQRNTAASSEANQQRKAMAKQKIDQLKARLRMLQMSGSVDPKVMAQLMRELKAAVKSYGGDAGGLPAVAQTSATTSGQTIDGSAKVETSSEDQAAGGAGAQTAEAAVAREADEGQTQEAETKDGEARGAAARNDPYRQMADAALARSAEAGRQTAMSKEDRDFMADARRLAEVMKGLAKAAADKARQKPSETQTTNELKAVAEALSRQIEDTAAGLGANSLSLTV